MEMFRSLVKPYPTTTEVSKVKLSQHDARSLLMLIRLRQDDLRRVTPEFPTYGVMQELDTALEKIKTKIVKQVK